MSQIKQAQLWLEVEQLKKQLENAAVLSPELWATIQQSVNIAELGSNSIRSEEDEASQIYSGAETTSLNNLKE